MVKDEVSVTDTLKHLPNKLRETKDGNLGLVQAGPWKDCPTLDQTVANKKGWGPGICLHLKSSLLFVTVYWSMPVCLFALVLLFWKPSRSPFATWSQFPVFRWLWLSRFPQRKIRLPTFTVRRRCCDWTERKMSGGELLPLWCEFRVRSVNFTESRRCCINSLVYIGADRAQHF